MKCPRARDTEAEDWKVTCKLMKASTGAGVGARSVAQQLEQIQPAESGGSQDINEPSSPPSTSRQQRRDPQSDPLLRRIPPHNPSSSPSDHRNSEASTTHHATHQQSTMILGRMQFGANTKLAVPWAQVYVCSTDHHHFQLRPYDSRYQRVPLGFVCQSGKVYRPFIVSSRTVEASDTTSDMTTTDGVVALLTEKQWSVDGKYSRARGGGEWYSAPPLTKCEGGKVVPGKAPCWGCYFRCSPAQRVGERYWKATCLLMRRLQ